MRSIETQLEAMISMSKLGRYEIVRLTLKCIEAMKRNEEYSKFTQIELINKALKNVVTNTAIHEKNSKLHKKKTKGC
ncbi:MAG: hypothetical protein LBI98_01570 [Endomicrobium sp.]|jgi:hypothetical protein|nr:hypothetical protein [Endomicrobium sp.]